MNGIISCCSQYHRALFEEDRHHYIYTSAIGRWQQSQTPCLIQQIVHINSACHLQRPTVCWLPGLWQRGKGSIPAKLAERKNKKEQFRWSLTQNKRYKCNLVDSTYRKIFREKKTSQSIITHWVDYKLFRAEAVFCYILRYRLAYRKSGSWTLLQCKLKTCSAYHNSLNWLHSSWGGNCWPWRQSTSVFITTTGLS